MEIREFFEGLEAQADSERLVGVERSFLFHIEDEGTWFVDVREGKLTVAEDGEGSPDLTIRTSRETFVRIKSGEQNPMTAYMTGKVKIEGDLSVALELQKLLG